VDILEDNEFDPFREVGVDGVCGERASWLDADWDATASDFGTERAVEVAIAMISISVR